MDRRIDHSDVGSMERGGYPAGAAAENRDTRVALREYAGWCDANEYEVPLCMGEHLRAAAEGLEAMRTPLPDNKANILLPLEMFFGRGILGVASVAEDESAPIREILIYRLPDPVMPIGSNLGDKGKHVEKLENVLVRMHFENAESAHVLERAVRIVLDSFGDPDNKALTVEELREMIGGCAWCKDTDGVNPGLLCLRHRWDDTQKEVHIWFLDEEGNTGVYDVEYMIKCGAKFYRRPPEKGE